MSGATDIDSEVSGLNAGRRFLRKVRDALPPSTVDWLRDRYDEAAWLFPERTALRLLYWKSHHRWPDLDQPRDYTEKLLSSRLLDPPYEKLADKLRVKDWVAARIGEKYVIPTLWSGKSLPPREERNWPLPFVIKINNGCGGHIFVSDKPDWDKIERQVSAMLGDDYGKRTREYFYSRIDPMILVEPKIGGDIPPIDYKYFTFGGRVHMFVVTTDRHLGRKETFFHPDGRRADLDMGQDSDPRFGDRAPAEALEMLPLAEKLAGGLPFSRVDLYFENGQPWFGEMTMMCGGGLIPVNPSEVDREFGDQWDWDRTIRLAKEKRIQ